MNNIEYYRKFDEMGKLNDLFRKRIDRREPVFSALLNNYPKGSRLLDVGCGVGRFLSHVSKHFNCTGIDISSDAISECKKVLPNNKFICGDIFNLKIQTRLEKYEVITVFDVLEHLTKPDRLLKILHSKLQPNGSLYLSVPNTEVISHVILKKNWSAWADKSHVSMFNRLEWQRLVKGQGFNIQKVYASGIINHPLPPYSLKGVMKGVHYLTQMAALYGCPLPQQLNDLHIWECRKE